MWGCGFRWQHCWHLGLQPKGYQRSKTYLCPSSFAGPVQKRQDSSEAWIASSSLALTGTTNSAILESLGLPSLA